MLYAFRDQNTWTAALCLGYVEWAARSVNQSIAWTEDDQSMRRDILPNTSIHYSLMIISSGNSAINMVYSSRQIRFSYTLP